MGTLRLDDEVRAPLSPESATLLTNIPLTGRHKVDIQGDGYAFSAFSFTFNEFSRANLCLAQSDLYLIWSFHPSTASYAPCRCAGVKPVDWHRSAVVP